MTGRKHRPTVSDRARRRAIREHAARLGVPYSVAARLLATPGGDRPVDHRSWMFAVRERRGFAQRVRDTRLAVDLPLGRAAHLAERFPVLRQSPAGPLYDGEARPVALGLLYALLAYESPHVQPGAEELAWVAELGEEAAVDIVCATLDQAARRLLDLDRWQLCTRVEAALDAGEAGSDRRVRDAAITLGRPFRTTILRRSWEGARQTLDALLIAAYGGHAPGDRARVLAGPYEGRTATVVGVTWSPSGGPRAYEVRLDEVAATITVSIEDVARPEQPTQPEPARP